MKQLLKTIPVAFFLSATLGNAATAITSWSLISGATAVIGGTNASPTLGNGTTNNADNHAMAATFTGGTLVNAGDTITLSGTVTFLGVESGAADQFRFGLFDVNGQAGNTGWLGYFATNANTTTTGRLAERSDPNSAIATSSTGVTSIQTATASGNAAFDFTTNTTYSFVLSYERLANGSLDIDWSLSNGAGYSLSSTFNDTTPETYAFNRVAFLTGDSQNADQLTFNNVDVTFTPVPEPSIALLGGLSVLGLLRRRRA